MDPDKRVHVIYTITAEQFDIRITAEGDGLRLVDPAPLNRLGRPTGSRRDLVRSRTLRGPAGEQLD